MKAQKKLIHLILFIWHYIDTHSENNNGRSLIVSLKGPTNHDTEHQKSSASNIIGSGGGLVHMLPSVLPKENECQRSN